MRFFEFQKADSVTPKSECHEKIERLRHETGMLRKKLSEIKNAKFGDFESIKELCITIKTINVVISTLKQEIEEKCPRFKDDPRLTNITAMAGWLSQQTKKYCGGK